MSKDMETAIQTRKLAKGERYCKGCKAIIRSRKNGRSQYYCSRQCYNLSMSNSRKTRGKVGKSSVERTIHLQNVIKNHRKRRSEIQMMSAPAQVVAGLLYREDMMYRSAIHESNTIGASLTPKQKIKYFPKKQSHKPKKPVFTSENSNIKIENVRRDVRHNHNNNPKTRPTNSFSKSDLKTRADESSDTSNLDFQ